MRDSEAQAPPTDFDAAERKNWAGQAQDYRSSFALLCAGAVLASGASWMRAFRASQDPPLLDRVRDRFDELSSHYLGDDGRLSLPVAALLAHGKA
jgi:hypothetical protein